MDEPNVVLIDDEEAFVTTLQERLEMRGFSPKVALNGQDGLELISQDPPDVVILDLRMPGMSGLEVLRRHPQVMAGTACDHAQRPRLRFRTSTPA